MHHKRCHNCGRSMSEDEAYCYFCDTEAEKSAEKHEKENKS